MEQSTDGRHLRRARGRERVVDAVIDFVSETGSAPTARDLAARAAVSEATVFRYFDSLDELQQQAIDRYFEKHADLFDIPDIGEGSQDERVRGLCRARTRLWSSIAPFADFGRSLAPGQPRLASSLHVVRVEQHAQVRRHFEPELAALSPAHRDDVTAVIATLTSFESWAQQRRDLGRSDRQITRSWERAVASVLRSE